MPEHVQLNKELEIIEVISVGDVTYEHLNNALASVIDLSKSTDYRCVLCDTQYQLSMPSVREFKNFIDSLPHDIVVSVLVSDNGPTRDIQHMGEAMAQRTKTPFKIFYEKEKAEEWLSSMKRYFNNG